MVMVKKLQSFSFASGAEKYFQHFSADMWWETFSLQRFQAHTEMKNSTVFFRCASCSRQEVAPMLLALLLAFLLQRSNSALPQSSGCFRMKGVGSPRDLNRRHRRVAKGRPRGFLSYVLKLTEIFQGPQQTHSNAFVPFFPMESLQSVKFQILIRCCPSLSLSAL